VVVVVVVLHLPIEYSMVQLIVVIQHLVSMMMEHISMLSLVTLLVLPVMAALQLIVLHVSLLKCLITVSVWLVRQLLGIVANLVLLRG
jgi:hypothetical protein